MLGLLFIIIAIYSSFYVNENSKKGAILLIIVGLLIFFYSAEFLTPYGYGYYIEIGGEWTPFNPWDLTFLAGIILVIGGIYEIIKNKMIGD